MSLSRVGYKRLAEDIKIELKFLSSVNDTELRTSRKAVQDFIQNVLCPFLKRDNQAFETETFLRACGIIK